MRAPRLGIRLCAPQLNANLLRLYGDNLLTFDPHGVAESVSMTDRSAPRVVKHASELLLHDEPTFLSMPAQRSVPIVPTLGSHCSDPVTMYWSLSVSPPAPPSLPDVHAFASTTSHGTLPTHARIRIHLAIRYQAHAMYYVP